ncbi:MAG TPA: hemerythrin domain-containing protein [Cellvibrionaceae bacterium]
MNSAARKSSQLLAFPLSTEATSLLRANYKFVAGLFQAYQKTSSAENRKELLMLICQELAIQAQLEIEIFYPAIKRCIKDKTLITQACVKHETIKYLMSELKDKNPDSEVFDAKVKNLGEYAAYYAKQVQNEIFPRARQTKVDMISLGDELLQRRNLLAKKHSATYRVNPSNKIAAAAAKNL